MLKNLVAVAAVLVVSSPAYALGWFHRAAERTDTQKHAAIDEHDLLHHQMNRNPLMDLNNLNNPLSPLSPLNPMSPMNPINQMNQMNQMTRMGRF